MGEREPGRALDLYQSHSAANSRGEVRVRRRLDPILEREVIEPARTVLGHEHLDLELDALAGFGGARAALDTETHAGLEHAVIAPTPVHIDMGRNRRIFIAQPDAMERHPVAAVMKFLGDAERSFIEFAEAHAGLDQRPIVHDVLVSEGIEAFLGVARRRAAYRPGA